MLEVLAVMCLLPRLSSPIMSVSTAIALQRNSLKPLNLSLPPSQERTVTLFHIM